VWPSKSVCALVGAVVLGPACEGSPAPLPPLGEVLVVADTDLSAPRLVNHLRVDLYSADGSSWYESREIDRSHPGDWPATFAVALTDGEADRVALVRLRAYAAGFVRDYRGERFLPRSPGSTSTLPAQPSTPFATACAECPREVDDQGNDRTPSSEPLPGVTVDRLVLVHVRPGALGAARVVLRGACLGNMADLSGLRTCVDTDSVLVDESEESLDPDLTVTAPSQLLGAFEAQYAQACTATPRAGTTAPDGTPLHDEDVCVPGGVFVFGSWDYFGTGPLTDDVPQRLAALPPFFMGKYEVTVGQWRAALAEGFTSPDSSPDDNQAALPTSSIPETDPTVCTWTSVPRPAAERRDEYPLSCVSWAAARAFCQRLGGDLPTEAQWEYAATATAGRPKSRYPWGGPAATPPTCARVVYGRGSLPSIDDLCNLDGGSFGALPVDAVDYDGGDRSPPLGLDGGDVTSFLVDLGGNLAEWTRDAEASFASPCWLGAPLVSPLCDVPPPASRVLRGGHWAAYDLTVSAAVRVPLDPTLLGHSAGLRCVRPAGGS